MSYDYEYTRDIVNGRYDIPFVNNIAIEVVNKIDFTLDEPDIEYGVCYLNTTTGISSKTATNVVANSIYRGNYVNWEEINPFELERIYNKNDNRLYFFEGSSWSAPINKNLAKAVEELFPDKHFRLFCSASECVFSFDEELSSGEISNLDSLVATYKSYGG